MTQEEISSTKVLAGVLAIVLGGFGIHKFILGSKSSSAYTTSGIIMLCASMLTCGFGAPVISIIGLIEGITYLTKSDSEFAAVYLDPEHPHPWF